jgi:hypothetical protein
LKPAREPFPHPNAIEKTAATITKAIRSGVVVSLGRAALWLPELGIFDRDYATKTAGSNDEHLYPDPATFVVDTPMGRYSGVKEMIEMSKTPGSSKAKDRAAPDLIRGRCTPSSKNGDDTSP